MGHYICILHVLISHWTYFNSNLYTRRLDKSQILPVLTQFYRVLTLPCKYPVPLWHTNSAGSTVFCAINDISLNA